jgi:hypothetical protein
MTKKVLKNIKEALIKNENIKEIDFCGKINE